MGYTSPLPPPPPSCSSQMTNSISLSNVSVDKVLRTPPSRRGVCKKIDRYILSPLHKYSPICLRVCNDASTMSHHLLEDRPATTQAHQSGHLLSVDAGQQHPHLVIYPKSPSNLLLGRSSTLSFSALSRPPGPHTKPTHSAMGSSTRCASDQGCC